MKIASEKFRIGDVAKKLNIERFVIRFWEREFGIKSHRSSGGQRFYSEKDLQRIMLIKELLYDNGFTIAGAKKHLQDQKTLSTKQGKGGKKLRITGATLDNTTPQPPSHEPHNACLQNRAEIAEKLAALKEQLIILRTRIQE